MDKKMISDSARLRAQDFLKISGQFRLGELITESSHPITANLSKVAKDDTAAALDLLFQVDGDVIEKYREWVESGRSQEIADVVERALRSSGRIFFTGCGATGRLSILLDSVWRGFWKKVRRKFAADWEDRTISLMAGGDFALIKSVEGFEDITEFGRRQIEDAGVCSRDVVFAITEGGETSWVIGTAWNALESGADVYFVYNNPDEILRKHVERSREIIDDTRIEKINLTTGPMAITGSTRMQATTIHLCVMMTILEIVACRLFYATKDTSPSPLAGEGWGEGDIPQQFLKALESIYKTIRSKDTLNQLAKLVETEESVYRNGGKVNYFADGLAIDVLTDTTERSPTFCIPPFKKWDDPDASDSWAFLFTPAETTQEVWEHLLKRKPRAVEWTLDQVRGMVGSDADQRYEVIKRIGLGEIYRFKIDQDGTAYRKLSSGDGTVRISLAEDKIKIESARIPDESDVIRIPLPETDFLLNGIARVVAKIILNAVSTCIMVRLGRVMGNYMIYVVPSNLKLIDRASRYVSQLTGLSYEDACLLIFDVIEYIEPRMKSDQTYPPVVGMAAIRAKEGVSNEEAETRLANQPP